MIWPPIVLEYVLSYFLLPKMKVLVAPSALLVIQNFSGIKKGKISDIGGNASFVFKVLFSILLDNDYYDVSEEIFQVCYATHFNVPNTPNKAN